MAKIESPCFDPCQFQLDDATGKTEMRLDPAGGVSCGPNGVRVQFPANSFIPNIAYAGGLVGIPGDGIGGLGIITPGSGAISPVFDSGVLTANPFPGDAIITMEAWCERFTVVNGNPATLIDCTSLLNVSPDNINAYQATQWQNAFCNGGGALAARGVGAGASGARWIVSAGWSGRPHFVFSHNNRGANPPDLVRAGTIGWRMMVHRLT